MHYSLIRSASNWTPLLALACRLGSEGLGRYRSEMGDDWLCLLMGAEVERATNAGTVDFTVLTLRDYLSHTFGDMPEEEYVSNLAGYANQARAFANGV
ncbi:MAG: hypothetical protein ACFHHU_00650 [Porticoccaceae bacterium]